MGPHPGPALGGQRERLYPPLPFLVSPSLVALFLSSTSLPFLTVHHHTHHICHNLPCSLPPDTQAGSGRDSPIIREFSPSTPNGTRMQEFYIRSPQHYPLCTAQARPLPSSLCLTSILTLLPVTYPPPRHGPPLLGSYRLSPPPLLLATLLTLFPPASTPRNPANTPPLMIRLASRPRSSHGKLSSTLQTCPTLNPSRCSLNGNPSSTSLGRS
jgi:hypothetical protein